jgi:hypothetical protein
MLLQSPEMEGLARIEKRGLQLLIPLLLASLLIQSGPVTLGLLTGGGVSLLNFRWLRFLWGKVIGEKKRAYALQAFLKFIVLVISVYLIFRFLPIHPVAFLVGISVLPTGIFWETMQGSFRYARRGNS